jgi:hypothetical protein
MRDLYGQRALVTPSNRADWQPLDSAFLSQSGEQIGTGGFASAAGLSANSAVLMHACVALTFSCAWSEHAGPLIFALG